MVVRTKSLVKTEKKSKTGLESRGFFYTPLKLHLAGPVYTYIYIYIYI